MTVREIVAVGHPVLRERTAEVDPADIAGVEVQGLIADLIDTMRHATAPASPPTRSAFRCVSP